MNSRVAILAILSVEIDFQCILNAMRTLTIGILVVLSHLTAMQTEASGGPESEKCEALYQRWHEVLDAHAHLSESSWIETKNVPPDLAAVVSDVESNAVGMAYFMCDKIAGATNNIVTMRMYRDVLLLHRVAGIDLVHSEPTGTPNIGENIKRFTAQFQDEWRRGIYKDPSTQVRAHCENLSEIGSDRLYADILPIRRYGIFALPELVRQIDTRNSKHAFTAYLIITWQPDDYAEYIRHSDQQFSTKQSKMQHLQARVESMKRAGGGDSDVMKKISAELEK